MAHGVRNKATAAMAVATACCCPALGLTIKMPEWAKVTISDQDLGGHVHMLQGFGGNIGVLTTPSGVLVVDSEYPELSEKIRSKIATLGRTKVDYLVNTHFHWDHSGGNIAMAANGAKVVASAQTARFLAEQQASKTKLPGQFTSDPRLLPSLIIDEGMLTVRIGEELVDIVHIGPAHTAGDLIVRFRNADVIQTGDAMVAGFYPYIDVDHGGTIDGAIAFCDQLYAMATPKTRIIPGHGEVTDRDYIPRYRAMLVQLRDRVDAAIRAGRTLDQLIAARPLDDLDPTWGGNLIKAPDILALVYSDRIRRR